MICIAWYLNFLHLNIYIYNLELFMQVHLENLKKKKLHNIPLVECAVYFIGFDKVFPYKIFFMMFEVGDLG